MSDRRGLFDDLLPGIRVGIDMDGVLADFNTGWMTRYNAEFGTDLRASMVQQWNGLHTLTHFESMAELKEMYGRRLVLPRSRWDELDDVLDITASTEVLGKTAAKDFSSVYSRTQYSKKKKSS